MRHLTAFVSALVFVGFIAGVAGCDKKGDAKGDKKGGASSGEFNCETVTAKNKQCGNELAEALLAGMELKPEMKGKFMERMKESFASDRFKEKCQRGWDSDKPRDVAMKETLKKCFAIKDCKEFAACYATSMKAGGMGMGRRGRRGAGGGMEGDEGHKHAPGDGHRHAPGDGHDH